MSTMQTLFILQGPPGSGKTRVAKLIELALDVRAGDDPSFTMICSTDDYFVNCQSGVYYYDPTRLAEFHRQNQASAASHLQRGYTVLVDNTNLQAWEAKPYVQAAVALNIPVVFIRCDGKFANIHGVPAEKVEQMRARMEPLSVEACLAALAPWEKPPVEENLEENRLVAAEKAFREYAPLPKIFDKGKWAKRPSTEFTDQLTRDVFFEDDQGISSWGHFIVSFKPNTSEVIEYGM